MSQFDYSSGQMLLADPDKDQLVFIETGYEVGEVTVLNTAQTDLPELKFFADQAGSTAAEGGVITDKASSVTRTEVPAADGVTPYAGGGTLKYLVAAIPTYQDNDATPFADYIYDAAGNDVLARELPAIATDNGATYLRKQGFYLDTQADWRIATADKLLIKWTRK